MSSRTSPATTGGDLFNNPSSPFRDPMVKIFGFLRDPIPLRNTCQLTLSVFDYAIFLEEHIHVGVVTTDPLALLTDEGGGPDEHNDSVASVPHWAPFVFSRTNHKRSKATGLTVPESAHPALVYRLRGDHGRWTDETKGKRGIENHSRDFLAALTSVESVIVEQNSDVETIPTDSLSECSTLKNLKLRQVSGLRSMGNFVAFACEQMVSVELSELSALQEIGSDFCKSCLSLETFLLENVPSLQKLGQNFLRFCGNLRSVSLVAMPNLVEIGIGFLSNCTKLIEVTLSELPRLKELTGAFQYCRSLSKVVLTELEGLTMIRDTWQGCESLSTVDLSRIENLRDLNNCFQFSGADQVVLQDLEKLHSIERFCHQSLTKVVRLTNLPSLRSIPTQFCDNCPHLTTVKLENLPELRSIGDNFLSNCPRLQSFELADLLSLSSIGSFFLNQGSSMKAFRMDNLPKLQSIGSNFLVNAEIEDELVIENLPQLSRIDDNCLYCSNVREITLRNLPQLSKLGQWAFSNFRGARVSFFNLPKLERLAEHFCSNFQGKEIEIVGLEALIFLGENSFAHSFQLQSLTLENLPKLPLEHPSYTDLFEDQLPSGCSIEGSWYRQYTAHKTGGSAEEEDTKGSKESVTGSLKVDQYHNVIGAPIYQVATELEDGTTITESVGRVCDSTKPKTLSPNAFNGNRGGSDPGQLKRIDRLEICSLPNLHTLQFYLFHGASVRSVTIADLPQLKTLSFTVQQQQSSKLEDFTLSGCPKLSLNESHLFGGGNGVKRVTIRDIKFEPKNRGDKPNGSVLLNFGGPQNFALEEIFVDGVYFPSSVLDSWRKENHDQPSGRYAGLGYISNLQSLRRLTIKNSNTITFGYSFLQQLPNLTFIELSNLPELEHIGVNFGYICSIKEFTLNDLPKLRKIQQGYMQHCPRLLRVGFKDLPQLEKIDPQGLCGQCPCLKEVAFFKVPRLNWASVLFLPNTLAFDPLNNTRLESIYLDASEDSPTSISSTDANNSQGNKEGSSSKRGKQKQQKPSNQELSLPKLKKLYQGISVAHETPLWLLRV